MKTLSKMFATVFCMFALIGVQAQAVSLCNEKFSSKTPQGWSIQPASTAAVPTWTPDKSLCVSANYSMHGSVPFNNGDTAELVTPYFDCSQYKYVMVQFSQICKVLPSDICEVMYQEQGLGSYYQWKPLPADAYRGKSATYARSLVFDHNSYAEWKGVDTFATPAADWWKEEQFDISDYASYTKIRFKFIIRKGSYYGSFIANGWHIDDFKVLVSNTLIKNPVVEFLTSFDDTVYSTGPFNIRAKVASRSKTPIKKPQLVYTVVLNKQTTQKALQMTAVEGDSIWTATIPQQVYGSSISYSIDASDSVGNTARAAAGFVLKRKPGIKITAYTYYQADDTLNPQYTNQYIVYPPRQTAQAYSRSLYLASEINPSGKAVSIASMAWHVSGSNSACSRNLKVWLMATTATTTAGNMNPVTSGATLVYSGITSSKTDWNEIEFNAPFTLPAGQNLMVFIESNGGTAASNYLYWSAHYVSQRNVYSTNMSTFTNSYYVPLMRFGLGYALNYDSNSVALQSIDQPGAGSLSGTQSVKVTLQNKGLLNLTSAKINWTVNGVLQQAYTWTGNLTTDFHASATIGSFNKRNNTFDTIVVWVSDPNGKKDAILVDDTLTAMPYGCDKSMSGTYTVGNGKQYDFQTVEEALFMLNVCGASADVTLKLAAQKGNSLSISNFNNLSSNARLTITSLDNNADSVVFTGIINALEIKKSSHIVFEKLSFITSKSGSHAVCFSGNCDDITFHNCYMQGIHYGDYESRAYATIYNNNGDLTNIRFIHNEIESGTYSFYLANGNVRYLNIDSNYIHHFMAGLDIENAMDVQVRHNEMYPGFISDYDRWVWRNMFLNSQNLLIDGNFIHSDLTNDDVEEQYAIYAEDNDSILICNNEIILSQGVEGRNFGIYTHGNTAGHIVNNSVLVAANQNSFDRSFGIAVETRSSTGSVRNNIAVGTHENACALYLQDNSMLGNFDFDYNCWYAPNVFAYIYDNTRWNNIDNMGDYRLFVPTATHDILQMPGFVNEESNLRLKNLTNMNCPMFNKLSWDKDGLMRTAGTTRGCYSCEPPQKDAGLLTILNWPGTTISGDTLLPYIVLQNGGKDTITAATIGYDLNGVAGNTIIWSGILATSECDTLPLSELILKTGYNTLTAYILTANGKKDSVTNDDTLHAVTYTCGSYFSGNYNVGDTCEFQTIEAAFNAINRCGINGPVTLRVMPGTYSTRLAIGMLPGISDTNTLTITSYTGKNDVVLQRIEENNNNGVANIIDGQHITLSHLVFDATCASNPVSYAYAHGVYVSGNSRNIKITDCEVIMPKPAGNAYTNPSTHSGICLNGRTVQNVDILNNTIDGGAAGVYVYGMSSTSRLRCVNIFNNTLKDMDYAGIYLLYTDSIQVRGNSISQRNGSYITPNMDAIYASYTNANIVNNHINALTLNRGIYLNSFGDSTFNNWNIVNNEVMGKISASNGCGLYVGAGSCARIYHNSIYVGSNQRLASGVWFSANLGSIAADFRNNIVFMNGRDFNNYPIYRASANNSDMSIGHNAYYNAYPGTPILAYVNDIITDWKDYRQMIPQDSTSKVVLPEFMNPNTNLRVSDTAGISCPSIAAANFDINDSVRTGNTTMGAYNFYRSNLDLAVKAILNPGIQGSTNNPEALKVVIANKGLATITSATLNYRLNGTLGTAFNWTGNLATSATDTLTLANIQILYGINELDVFLSKVNGTADNAQGNDTVHHIVYGCNGPMAGTYTIGGANANFSSISDALSTMNICGLGGNVTFKLADGTYPSAMFENFTMTDYDRIVTFTSASGNPDKVVFYGNSGLYVKNSKYITFESVTLKGDITGAQLEQNVNYIRIKHCNILVPDTVTSPEYRGISYDNVSGSGYYISNCEFIGNRIQGGYYNIYIKHGTSGSQSSNTLRLAIDSNIMSDAYRYGLFSTQANDIRSLNYNTITNGSHAESFDGIYMETATNCDSIFGNTIHIKTPKKSNGIYGSGTQNNPAWMCGNRRVSNNEIIVRSGEESYGIRYVNFGGYATLVNNSIYVEGENASYAMALGSGYTMQYDNNILIGGNANSVPLFLSASGAIYQGDYNNYASASGILAVTAGINRSSIASLQALYSGNDVHSTALKVNLKDTTFGNLRMNNSWDFSCPINDNVNYDITGTPRTYVTSMGCYDFEAETIDAGLVAFAGEGMLTSTGKHNLSVLVKNYGIADITSAAVALYINGTKVADAPYYPKTVLANNQIDSVALGSFNFPGGNCDLMAIVTLNGDKNTKNDTIRLQKKICGQIVGGTYVIGNSANADYSFANYTDLFALADTCGIYADVVLEFESGTYTFASDLNLNTNFMKGYHLTWTSQAHNRDSVTFISNLAASTVNGMFTLNNANNVTFCDLTLTSAARTLFQVNGPNRNVEIRHCNLFNSRTATAGATMTITNGDNPSNYYKQQNWRVIGNHFEGGCRSFKFRGSTTEPLLNWTIDSNLFEYGYDRVVQLENVDTLYFRYNQIYSRTSTTAAHFQLYTYNLEHATIVGNLFDATPSNTNLTASVVTLYGANYNSDETCLLANNVIKVKNMSGKAVNLHGKINFVHNSIYMSGNGTNGYGIWLYQAASVLKTYGNVFYTMGGQTPIGVDAAVIGANNKFDYNNYYSNSGNIMEWGGTKLKSISAVRLTNLQDTHSISVPLNFIDPNIDLRLTSYAPVLMPNMGYIGYDFYGNPRSNPTAMGAYEPSFQKLDATLSDFANTTFSGPQSTAISVTLMNAGTDTLKTADIDWSFNGVQQSQVKWTGSLPVGGTTIVALGNVVPVVGSVSRLVAWVSNPNNGKDSKPDNDTVSMSEYVCQGTLSGTYTVGGSNPDFADLSEAMFSLNTCGISAPVVLKFRSGTYAATTIEGNVKGASATNTITVMPDAGATVVFDGGSTAAALTVKNIAHWVFKGLTLGNTTNGLTGVLMQENLQNVTFRDCDILASTSATSTTYRAVSYPNTSGSGKYPVDVRFIHNNIVGGYYNFYLYYTASSMGTMGAASLLIDSNTLSEAYFYGIYTYYYSAIKSLCYNTFTNRSNSSSFYGVYSYYYAYWDKIEGNHMNLTASGTTYGFYLSYYNQYASYTSSQKAYLVNNEVILNSKAGTKYGVYLYYPYGFWEIHHNSVYLKSGATKYGMYLYNTSTSYKINATRNHIICDSTGTNYPLYLSSATYATAAYGLREYNNLYSSTNVAYVGGAITNIASLQSTSAQDSFSLKIQPAFENSNSSLRLTDYSPFACHRTNDALMDIDGKFRGNATSIGCYGAKMYDGINLEVCEFVSPKAITDVICYNDYTPVAVSIKNSGMKDAHFDSSDLKVSMIVTGATTYRLDTVITAGSLRSSWTDTLYLGNIPTMASGAYHIHITLTDTADHRNDDDTLSLVYNAYRVELPYDVNFSTQPREFVNNIKSGTSGWSVVQGAGHNPAIAPAFGTGRLEFAGAGEPGAFANAIFNAVNIRGCIKPRLSFWYAHAECDKRDMMIVLVTSDGGASYTEVGRVIAADTADYWKRYDFDLTPFSNTPCLSVVFQAVSFGGVNQSIDRVLISAETDVELSMLPIDMNSRTACDNTPVEVKAVLSNNSPTSLQLVNDTISLNISGATTQTSKYIYNGTLAGYASDTITVGQFNMTANGNYYVEIFMQSQDDNRSNDTLRDSTILVDQNIALTAIQGIDDHNYKMTGDSVRVSAVIANKGNIHIGRYTVSVDINGETVLTDTVNNLLKAGDSCVHAMSMPFVVPAATKDQPFYVIGMTAAISCDVDEDDNTVEIVAPVNIPDTTDLQVLDITANSPVKGKTKQAPSVRVANVGNAAVYNVNIYVVVMDSTGKTIDNISGIINEIQPGASENYLFTMNYTVPNYNGNYTLKAFVEKQQADSIQSNDTLSKVFSCTLDDTRIGESETEGWNMGQNIPNPASGITRIPFSLPVSGKVTFSVMSANGQLIYREEIHAEAGNSGISFDASNIAGGIYYYSMEYQGQRIVKKMNVVR